MKILVIVMSLALATTSAMAHAPEVKAIRRVLDNYSSFASTGEAMSRHARDRFAISKMVERHVSLYRRLTYLRVPRRHNPKYAGLNFLVRHGLRRHARASSPTPKPQPLTPLS